MGMIKLFMTIEGNPTTINCRCRVIKVHPDGLDVDAQFAYMKKTDIAHFESLILSA